MGDTEGYAIPKSSARLSGLLSEVLSQADDDEELKIPVNNLHPEVVRAVAAYMIHFADPEGEQPKASQIPKPCPGTSLVPPDVTKFEADFVAELLPPLGRRDFRVHTTLMNAANYLNLKDNLLLLLGCSLAMRVKGKTLDEVRDLFADQLPLTVVDEFAWA